MRWLTLIFAFCAGPIWADTVVAARTIAAKTVLSAADLTVITADHPHMLERLDQAIGLETKTTLYEGRPLSASHLRTPALVDRNQIVPLIFRQNGLTITTDGRALERAAQGDVIRAMNLASKITVSGRVLEDGTILVGGDG